VRPPGVRARHLLPIALCVPALLAGCGGSGSTSNLKSACAKAKTAAEGDHSTLSKYGSAFLAGKHTEAVFAAITELEHAVSAVAAAASGEKATQMSEYAGTLARQQRVLHAVLAHETDVVRRYDPGLSEALHEGAEQLKQVCG
jgi:hypothetical protein